MSIFNSAITPISIDKTANSSLQGLKEGGFVFVRVLSVQGSKATVSFAGGRFNVTLQQPLKAGISFAAKITVQDNKILLSPQLPAQDVELFSNDSLNQFLLSIGLPSDSSSVSLVNTMQQLGLVFKPDVLQKARRIAQAFPGNEIRAAEIVLLLEDKGMQADVSLVALFMGILESSPVGQDSSSDSQKKDDSDDSNLITRLYNNPEFLNNQQPGLLTIFNHLAGSNFHWLVLPFQLSIKNNQVNGTIRILLDICQKKVKKILIHTIFPDKSLFFVVYYKNVDYNEIDVVFSANPTLGPEQQRVETELLTKMFKTLHCKSIRYDQNLSISNFYEQFVIKTVDVVI